MVADAHDALGALPGSGRGPGGLLDHFVSAEINDGVAAGAGSPARSRAGDRRSWRSCARPSSGRRTWPASTASCHHLVKDGWETGLSPTSGCATSPTPPAAAGCCAGGRRLGLPTEPDEPVLVDDEGTAIPTENQTKVLRFAKAVRVSVEGTPRSAAGC